MKTILFRNRSFLPFLLIASIFGALYLVTHSSVYQEHQSILPRAVAIDLIVSVPLLYFLLIRKTKIPVLTVIPVFLWSMFIGSSWNVQADGFFSSVNQYKFYIAESLFIVLESIMVYKIRKAYRKIKRGYAFFREDMYAASFSYFKIERIAQVMATEVTMFYYLFSRYQPVRSAHTFSYHKKSGKVLTIFLIVLLLVESTGVHLLVEHWSVILAWVLTISSLYFVLVLMAHYRAAVRLPIEMTENGLLLRNGLLYSTFIPYTAIAGIHTTAYTSALKNKHPLYINTIPGFGSVNLVIDLKEEMETPGMYGAIKRFDTLAFELDEKKTFLQQLELYLPLQQKA